MSGFKISFAQMFGGGGAGQSPVGINQIEIPLIQRDYAQGRKSKTVDRIRENFLRTLSQAVLGQSQPVDLDFVFGDITSNGEFYPLDGQQRLTTLFLLHWYIAWRAYLLSENEFLSRFSYHTRPSARNFCGKLAESCPPQDLKHLSEWFLDQPWFLFTWEQDPTIMSMLVVLDDLHHMFAGKTGEEMLDAWQRLTSSTDPAISFHVLPMESMGLTDDLYIKMNSRGKKLTDFENFKGHFEELIEAINKKKADFFAQKVDIEWANTLWPYRGSDNLVDDEFSRYFRFVTEVSAWLTDVDVERADHIDDLADAVYGKGNPAAEQCLDRLLKFFDVWHGRDIREIFEKHFTPTPEPQFSGTVLFNFFRNPVDDQSPVDLFGACCNFYGSKAWALSHTLYLYAVLQHLVHDSEDFSRRLRVLRNLIEASEDDIRATDMKRHLEDVKRVILDGNVSEVVSFQSAQVFNELEKAELIESQPESAGKIFELEDHNILRGCLIAFDLDPQQAPGVLGRRADALMKIFGDRSCWLDLTGALLAVGDYSAKKNRSEGYYTADLGTSSLGREIDRPWSDLLRKKIAKTTLRNILMDFLDRVSASESYVEAMKAIQQEFLAECEQQARLDWRYYFVKYPFMRHGRSGRYTLSSDGYDACMLNVQMMSSNWRDPYLYAVARLAGADEYLAQPWPWFYGYETKERFMNLVRSGIGVRCVGGGWLFKFNPENLQSQNTFDAIREKYSIGPGNMLAIPQSGNIDTIDRVELMSNVLKDLISEGL